MRWKAALGNRPLRQIVPGDVARFARQRREAGFAPASINRELAFLRRAFNVAIADEKADKNPVLSRKRGGSFVSTGLSDEDATAITQGEPTSRAIGGMRKWRRPGSNRGPRDYES